MSNRPVSPPRISKSKQVVLVREVHYLKNNVRIFSDEFLNPGDLVLFKLDGFRIQSVSATTINSWRGKYRYDCDQVFGSELTSCVKKLVLD